MCCLHPRFVRWRPFSAGEAQDVVSRCAVAAWDGRSRLGPTNPQSGKAPAGERFRSLRNSQQSDRLYERFRMAVQRHKLQNEAARKVGCAKENAL
jgi:hypothetical protein